MEIRQKIVEEAANMFRTYGIRAVTMDMLANELGMSKRTIYENFSDKDELLSGVLRLMAEKQDEVTLKVFHESDNVIEAIFRLFDMMAEHFRNMSPAFRLDMEKYHNDIIQKLKDTGELPYQANNEKMLKQGIKEGVFRKDIDISITNKCLTEVIRLSNNRESFLDEENQKQHLFRDFYINYLRGISTPKGLELINYYEKHK